MIYLKSFLAGLVASIVAVVVWVLVVVILSLFVNVSLAGNEGSGGLGFVIMSRDLYAAALFGFMMGFYWQFRRLKRGGINRAG